MAAAATIALSVILIRELAEPVTLRIPALSIEVECRRVPVADSEDLQRVIDEPDTAAWCGRYIMDHAGENFSGLWNIRVGDAVELGGRRYICGFITTGRSSCGVQGRGGTLPRADLYLCTCVPGGEEYEIYIVGVNKKK